MRRRLLVMHPSGRWGHNAVASGLQMPMGDASLPACPWACACGRAGGSVVVRVRPAAGVTIVRSVVKLVICHHQ